MSICIPTTGSSLWVDLEISNMEFFFHKQYVIFPQDFQLKTVSKPMKLYS